MRNFVRRSVLIALAVSMLAPVSVLAQEEASIAGTVQDDTGAVLPGVAVNVSGPSLLAARDAFSDASGNYLITNLPSGEYTVTFTLQGFGTVVREGVVLQGAFVAEVDANLAVGAVAETLTVRGAAPLVDVKSTRNQQVLTADRVNVLPGAANIYQAAQYVPGVAIGGPYGGRPELHGSDALDGLPAIDGVQTGAQLQGRGEWGGGIGGVTNEAQVTEVVFDVASQSAEYATSGMRTNVVPKSGGNTFAYNLFATGTRSRFQSNNLSQELQDQGFAFAPTDYTWTLNPAVGGPLVRDKLWFFGSVLTGQSRNFILDQFFDLDEPSTPDGVTADDLRAFNKRTPNQQSLRLTWQATQRHKFALNIMHENTPYTRAMPSGVFGDIDPASAYQGDSPDLLVSTRWTAPVTNALLLEADFAYQKAYIRTRPMDHGEARMQVSDVATGAVTQSSFQNHNNIDYHHRVNASLSYVTGSHNFKAGLKYDRNNTSLAYTPPGEIFSGYAFNGFPIGILVGVNGSSRSNINMNCDCGLYVQDSWTLDRLTINGGFRFDWFNNSVPGGTRPEGFWAPALTLADPIIEDVPNWKNFNGRFGVAYDLFGDGSTAVKASAGRFVEYHGTGLTQGFNPVNAYALDWRSWFDINGDGTALDPDGTPQFAEVGPSNNPNFGTGTIQTQLDPDAPRNTNWEYSAGIERQLGPGWSVSGMWHRRAFGNFRWTDNLNTSADDWSLAGMWTGPTDPRLPPQAQGISVPIYTTSPTLNILTGNDLLTAATEDWRTWNGFEVIVDGELWRGGFMTASVTAGKATNNFCQSGVSENPNNLWHCSYSTPYRPMAKLSGGLPLPFDTMISGIFQVFPGEEIQANYTIDQTDFPGLVNLGNTTDVTPTLEIGLIEPGTEFEPYRTQTNFRFSKVVTVGDVRTRIYMDAQNIFNKARVTSRNRFFGGGGVNNPDFLRVINIEPGRVLSFGLQTYF